MKFKVNIKASKESKEEIKATLEEILHKIENDEQLYMGEVVYLQSHKRDIKRFFPNEPRLWEWADIPEEEYNKSIGSSKKVKSGESYGWVVNTEDAWDKLWLFVDAVGEKEALEALARAMGNDELSDNLAYIFRMYDFKEGCSDYEPEEDDE